MFDTIVTDGTTATTPHWSPPAVPASKSSVLPDTDDAILMRPEGGEVSR